MKRLFVRLEIIPYIKFSFHFIVETVLSRIYRAVEFNYLLLTCK